MRYKKRHNFKLIVVQACSKLYVHLSVCIFFSNLQYMVLPLLFFLAIKIIVFLPIVKDKIRLILHLMNQILKPSTKFLLIFLKFWIPIFTESTGTIYSILIGYKWFLLIWEKQDIHLMDLATKKLLSYIIYTYPGW